MQFSGIFAVNQRACQHFYGYIGIMICMLLLFDNRISIMRSGVVTFKITDQQFQQNRGCNFFHASNASRGLTVFLRLIIDCFKYETKVTIFIWFFNLSNRSRTLVSDIRMQSRYQLNFMYSSGSFSAAFTISYFHSQYKIYLVICFKNHYTTIKNHVN